MKVFKYVLAVFSILILGLGSSSAQTIDDQFFGEVDQFLKKHVTDGLVNYAAIQKDESFAELIAQVNDADLTGANANIIQAFYINAYNLHVINNVIKSYPIKSVMDQGGFFDQNKVRVAKELLTLNELENQKLLAVYQDARFHFVLVCGANGCPPITNFAYTPQGLEGQMERQTKLALNDNSFIKASNETVELSEVFKWYTSDFGKNKQEVLAFINNYRQEKISPNAKVKYYTYDWSLNDLSKGTGALKVAPKTSNASNESRYIVSSTIPKGSVELKIFNNLYSQQTGNQEELFDRSSFFTTSISAFYGLTRRFNVGIATRVRKVRNNPLPSSPFSVFGSGDIGSSRSGLTAFGPQIRYAPIPKWKNFSIQSSLVFAIGEDLAGSATEPYIDWNGMTWNTQFFNDFSIGSQFSLFTEIDILIEDIGADGNNNRFSTPVTGIFSYIPTNKITIYTLAGYSPFWGSEFDYFTQFGVGSKYQFTPKFELEVLYTDFSNKFLNTSGGKAETINLGIRINI